MLIILQSFNSSSFFNIFPRQLGAVLILTSGKHSRVLCWRPGTARELLGRCDWWSDHPSYLDFCPPSDFNSIFGVSQQCFWILPFKEWTQSCLFFTCEDLSLPRQKDCCFANWMFCLPAALALLCANTVVRRWHEDPAVGVTCDQAVSIKEKKQLVKSSSWGNPTPILS